MVIKSSSKLPRCPNGTHRSPNGECEPVSGSTSRDSSSSSSSDIASSQVGIFTETNSNNPINNELQQQSEPQNSFPSLSNTVTGSTATVNDANTTASMNPRQENVINHYGIMFITQKDYK